MLIDAHIHLQDDIGLRADLLNHAREYHIGKFYCNGITPEDWAIIDLITGTDARVIPFFGVHPWKATEVKEGWDVLLEGFLKKPNSGVGEIGLDKFREKISYDKQVEIFCRQLAIAGRLSKPVTIHCVRAWGDLLNILKKNLLPRSRFLLHSYHGSSEMLQEFLNLGAYISFSWKSFLRPGTEMRDMVRHMPLNRLFLETDFPYLEPQAMGATINIEKYKRCLHEAYDFAARVKGLKFYEIEDAVWENGAAFLH